MNTNITTHSTMTTTKKRTWKFWVSRTLLLVLLIGSVWLVNLIWFRPFSIGQFYDRVFIEVALRSPETVTLLGVPVLYDLTKDEWDDVSDARLRSDFQKNKETYATLQSYDFGSQSDANKLNTKILGWYIKNALDGEQFFYHAYPLNQMFGVQSNMPNLLVNNHKLRSEGDIKAYIARLSGFTTKFDQVLEGLKIREKKGIVPPKFVIKRVLDEMKGFICTGVDKNILYTNFTGKVAKLDGLSADEKAAYAKQVADKIQTSVFGAYQKLIAYNEGLYAKATTDDGVWKLPNGDAYYRYQLRANTTTDLSPEAVHQIGLREVSRIKKEMRAILTSEGYTDTTKSIGSVMQGMGQEEHFLYPETPAGKVLVLAEYTRIINVASKNLDVAFDMRPKADLVVERVPAFKEAGMAKGSYIGPALDGSKGGVFFANVRKVSEHPKYGMKTLVYHEGIPGHHFQIGIQTELNRSAEVRLPIFRTVVPFTAYSEGWALYSEQLAYELGFYKNDPFGNLGRLQAEMWRAVRLVVDTGIHYKRWTREKAIGYMTTNTGISDGEVTTEIERYIVMPGQACAYKIGMMKIVALREKAKQTLGPKFDLKQFHRVVLANGAVPLFILEENVNAYIQQKK
jgi:uncharacterized protein (DUF885 family)